MNTGKKGRGSKLKNRGQQDKRPRHVCAAKILSAHQFLRHASSPPVCRCTCNPALGLTFLRAYCARLRSTGMDAINVE
jgi:hypothetical protein